MHNDKICPKYNEPVLPDEKGNCSPCGEEIVEQDLRQSNLLLNRNGTQPVDSRLTAGASAPVYISKTHFAEDPGHSISKKEDQGADEFLSCKAEGMIDAYKIHSPSMTYNMTSLIERERQADRLKKWPTTLGMSTRKGLRLFWGQLRCSKQSFNVAEDIALLTMGGASLGMSGLPSTYGDYGEAGLLDICGLRKV